MTRVRSDRIKQIVAIKPLNTCDTGIHGLSLKGNMYNLRRVGSGPNQWVLEAESPKIYN